MFAKREIAQEIPQEISKSELTASEKAVLRRLMYERMAEGNRLLEAEEDAKTQLLGSAIKR